MLADARTAALLAPCSFAVVLADDKNTLLFYVVSWPLASSDNAGPGAWVDTGWLWQGREPDRCGAWATVAVARSPKKRQGCTVTSRRSIHCPKKALKKKTRTLPTEESKK